MIGPKFRFVLIVTAWLLIVFGLISRILAFSESGSFERILEWWPNLFGQAAELASPIVSGGLLLVLLSIDQRIQNRGQ